MKARKFRSIRLALLSLAVLGLLVACRNEPTPVPTTAAEVVPTETAAPTSVPTDTPTPDATNTPAASDTPAVPTETPTITPTPGPTGIPEIVVHVRNAATGDAVRGATVSLFISALNFSVEEETNEVGVARFVNMAAGVYPLTITALTYEEGSQEIVVGGGENVIEVALNRLPPPQVFAVSDTGRANLRNGPGNGFNIIRKIEFGERVEVIGRTFGGDWLLVRTNDGQEGWVATNVMQVDQPVEIVYEATPAPTSTPTPLPVVNGVTVILTNLRERSGPDAPLIMELPEGTAVQVLAQTEDQNWLYVRTAEGIEGWLFAELVQLDAPQETIPLYVPTPFPTVTPDPNYTPPPTLPPTATPLPTATTFPTPRPGNGLPAPVPFNPLAFQANAIYLDNHVVILGGLLDRLFQEGYDAEVCEQFILYYRLVEASPRYTNVPPDWVGPHYLYQLAQDAVWSNNDEIVTACNEGGQVTELNYSLARDSINSGHNWLVSAIEQANNILGPPP